MIIKSIERYGESDPNLKYFNCPKCYATCAYTIAHGSEAEKDAKSNQFILSASLMVFCNGCGELAVQLVTHKYTEGESPEREDDARWTQENLP